MSDQSPRSALEIAMERLRRKDAEEGVERRLPTDQERAAIAEIRNAYGAKLAQEEVMHASALRQTFDSAKRAELDTPIGVTASGSSPSVIQRSNGYAAERARPDRHWCRSHIRMACLV